ncbi:NVEALA domain-containing protein [uncultured Bacteroides sp.]|uniref:NVEALA domain-containing protein n=1 Tax=uncultured Bacteroides sp. TaxID=162156 RepID=UPI0025D2A9D9|nr:NVEALA domain-containing protein [uncultured Bacteroides sp.]
MKKILKMAFVAAFAAVAGYGVYANQQSEVISGLILANVEALADHGESSGFKAGYTASNYQYYIYGYGFTTIPCCKYNGNQFSGCSAIDTCP